MREKTGFRLHGLFPEQQIYSSLTTDVFSETYNPSKNFLISLFFTVVDCWIRAADCETASMELPWTISSSFWALEFSTTTPSCILTRRMNFSPRKFLTSIRVPPSVMAQEMGKCAYTALILYRKPFITPLKRFSMWEQTVLTDANCFFFPNHFSTLMVSLSTM